MSDNFIEVFVEYPGEDSDEGFIDHLFVYRQGDSLIDYKEDELLDMSSCWYLPEQTLYNPYNLDALRVLLDEIEARMKEEE